MVSQTPAPSSFFAFCFRRSFREPLSYRFAMCGVLFTRGYSSASGRGFSCSGAAPDDGFDAVDTYSADLRAGKAAPGAAPGRGFSCSGAAPDDGFDAVDTYSADLRAGKADAGSDPRR